MAVGFQIESITFSDGTTVPVQAGEIVVIVGPNNSGKSASLRAIREKILSPKHESPVISSLQSSRTGTEGELLTWLEAKSRREERKPGDPQFSSFGGVVRQSAAASYWKDANSGLNELTAWFCRLLTAETRVTDSNSPGRINFTNQAPQHPIHLIERDDRLEFRLSGYFRKAFGVDLILNRGAGASIPLVVGERVLPKAGEDRVSFDYLQELEKLPLLQTQGDGMRSFAGVLLNTLVGDEPIILIDEPEAFLHPPQARLLGRMLADEKSVSRQAVVATHSTDVLRGLLETRKNPIRVVRVQRDGSINRVATLDNTKIKQLWNDPLLRYSSILDGLFHEGVVLCEGDGDCRFYSAIADALHELKGEDFRSPDLMFTHCGGKARMPMVVRALREVDVPVVVVADFDVLNDESPLRQIVEAIGGNWAALEPDWKHVKASVDAKKPELDSTEVKKEIEEILAKVTASPFPKDARTQIEKILKRSSPWAVARSTGKAYVPSGQASASLERLFSSLRAIGICVVERGELEGFAKTIGGHGPAWVNEALKLDLARSPDLAEARKFVANFCTPARPDVRATVDRHSQKHQSSCATSLAEMLIKLENESAPDLQQHEKQKSTGLDHIKDKSYGWLTFRQLTGDWQKGIGDKVRDGRLVGLFIKNEYFDKSSIGIHAWVAHALFDDNGIAKLRLIAKGSELGNGEGKVTIEREIPLSDVNNANVTDVIWCERIVP